MAQEVVMLGTGNAFMPYGRYHSFAMIDGKHVVDCPPTAMASFRRAGVASERHRDDLHHPRPRRPCVWIPFLFA